MTAQSFRQMGKRFDDIPDSLASSGPDESPTSGIRRTRIAMTVTALLILLFLGWSAWDDIRKRMENERTLAAQVTEAEIEELSERLQSLENRLIGFVNREQEVLNRLAHAPDFADTGGDLFSLLQSHFPQVTSVLVLDAQGIRVGNLGEPLDDSDERYLRQFARGKKPSIRFTSREGKVYVSIASAWFDRGKVAGDLLLSLGCTELCAPPFPPPPGHRLSLVPATPPEPRNGGQFQHPGAPGPTLARVALRDTDWVLVDRLDPEYVSNIFRTGWALALGIGAAFVLVILALYRWAGSRSQNADQNRSDQQETQLKLQAILAAITDGIILTDLQRRIELFNPAAEMMFGYLTEDVLNTDLFKLLPDFFSSENTDSLLRQQTAAGAPPLVRETRGRHKGGKEFPVRLWVNLVHFDEKPRLLIVSQDLTEHERNEEHLAFLEQRDALTGLLNRRELEQRLYAILADRKLGPDCPHVLCHIDVDRLKLVNDTCGHEAGDELLKQLAILIKAKLTEAELIGRMGGDEFVILFQDRTEAKVREICNDLTQTVRNFLFTWRDQSFDVAVSIGLAEFTPESESPSSALSKADVACHMAKSHGRDRIHTYHEGDLELIRHHGDMHLVSTISHALSEGRFHLHAQPIMPIAETRSRQRHFEILVRMVDETGAPVIPDQFIPAAERYILMPAVDRWIINHLFSLQSENLRAWHRIHPDSFLFAVNLSGTSITDEGFLRYLKRQFTEWDVPHQSICFEITETAAVGDLERARSFMEELSALGCSFALDDFGAGLSSYRYLRELPVDYLKIDGSFVRGMIEDPVNYALVESITQIGHVLGLQTIAEWAEDKATLTQLRALNVDFAQGFGIGEPMPVCDLTLADAALPPLIEGKTDDRRRSTRQSRRSAARPT